MTQDVVSHPDEMVLCKVQSRWSRNQLLNQQGMFRFRDVTTLSAINNIALKKRSKIITARGEDPHAVMGAKKVMGHWMLRMSVFGPYYLKHLCPIASV